MAKVRKAGEHTGGFSNRENGISPLEKHTPFPSPLELNNGRRGRGCIPLHLNRLKVGQ